MRIFTTITNDYITIDGVKIAVRWNDVTKGSSFFIPTVNPANVRNAILKVATINKWKLSSDVRIENNLYGIRFWRVL